MYTWERPEVGEHICADCCDWDRLNNSAGGPSKCGAPLSGPAGFSAPALNQSAWLRYSGDMSEPLRARLPEVRVQADRPALRSPIGRETVLLFFTSCCPSELARGRCRSSWRTALMRQVAQWKFDAQCALYFVLLFKKRQSSGGGWVFSWH